MSNYDRDILIENVNTLLKENRMTQKGLADILDMSQPNISKALNKNEKKNFSLDQIVGIADYFHTTVDALLNRSSSSDIRITPRSTAAFLAKLISQHDAKFVSINKPEETFTPVWDSELPFPSCKKEDKEISYPAIYLPSYWEVPKYTGTENEEVMLLQAEAEHGGNETHMLPVNSFLTQYKEIYEIYDKGGLSLETYNAVLEDMLSRLKD